MTKRKFAVFDIDGTLIRWQLYHAVVDRLAKQQLLGPDAHQALHQARMGWKRREHPEAFRQYELALIDIYESALDKLSATDFDQATHEVIEEYGNQTYVYTKNLILDLKEQGYMLLAISGSHHELVERIAREYGFDDWVGSKYERQGNQFSGHKTIASFDKKATLQDFIKKHNLTAKDSLAIGDSGSDAAMLEVVEQPIAFNPDQNLYQRAKQEGWKIVIERKNVIYELEQDHGQYNLV